MLGFDPSQPFLRNGVCLGWLKPGDIWNGLYGIQSVILNHFIEVFNGANEMANRQVSVLTILLLRFGTFRYIFFYLYLQ